MSLVRTDSGGGTAAMTLDVSFPSCDEGMVYADMGQIWAIGIAACAVVWSLKSFILKLTLPQ